MSVKFFARHTTTHKTQHTTTHNTQHTTHVWSACVSKILTDIFFYVRDIPQSTRTISEYNLIKWCQWDHLLDRILMGLRVRAAGLKLFMVSIKDLVCQLCIGCSLSLSNNGTKLCVITDIFGLSYSFWLVPTVLSWFIFLPHSVLLENEKDYYYLHNKIQLFVNHRLSLKISNLNESHARSNLGRVKTHLMWIL